MEASMSRKFDLRAAVWAGIVAGIVFIALEMVLVAVVQGMSPWAPPRMIAAIVMGEGVLPPMEAPVTFDATVFAVAMAVHFALSILLAMILGWGVSRFGLGMAASIAAGLVFGLAVYAVNFYGFTAVFPWFAMARGPIGIVAHAVFGVVAGGVYRRLEGQSAERLAPEQPA
jgi:hypothetical protein